MTAKTADATSSHVTKQFAEIDKRIRESHQVQDRATQQARAVLESKLDVVSDGLKAVETVQRALALKGDSTEKSVAESHSRMQTLQQHFEERVREEHESGQKTLQSVWGELNAQKVAQEKKHQAAEEHWQAVATKLDQQIVDATATIYGKLTDLKASLKSTADAIAEQSKEADVHHDRQIKEVERSLAQNGLEDQQRCQQLEQSMMDKDKRIAAQLHELQARLNDRMAENRQAMLDMQRAAAGKLSDQVCSPKLTVGFSQSSYILITYRVVAVVPVVTPPNGVGGDRTAKLAVTTTTVRHSDGTTTVVTSAGGAKL